MSTSLNQISVAFLATNGVEESELSKPWQALKDAGAKVTLVSLEPGEIQAEKANEKTKKFKVDKTIGDVKAEEFDALVLPGGLGNPDTLRSNSEAVKFVRDFCAQRKPISAICHGPWLLAEADVLKGRKVTSYQSIKTDLKNAGATWVDEEVVEDHGLITSRSPEDLDAFCEKTIELIGRTGSKRRAA